MIMLKHCPLLSYCLDFLIPLYNFPLLIAHQLLHTLPLILFPFLHYSFSTTPFRCIRSINPALVKCLPVQSLKKRMFLDIAKRKSTALRGVFVEKFRD